MVHGNHSACEGPLGEQIKRADPKNGNGSSYRRVAVIDRVISI